MVADSQIPTRLLLVLSSRREEIITEIIRTFDEYSPNSTLALLPIQDRRDWTNYEIEIMVSVLVGTAEPPKAQYHALPTSLIERGMGISEIIETYFYVNKKALFPFVWDEFSANVYELQAAILSLDLCLLKYTSRITSKFADESYHRLIIEREYSSMMGERFRLAREIHDNLAQALAVVNMKASLAIDDIKKEDQQLSINHLLEIKEIATTAYSESRDALLSLRISATDTANFIALLVAYLEKFEKTYQIPIIFYTNSDEIFLEKNDMTQLFCIIREALVNIQRHANASQGELIIEKGENGIKITINDDGRGFPSGQKIKRNQFGIGIQVMTERAQSIGANLSISSKLHKGTKVEIWIPTQPQRIPQVEK